MSKRFLISDVDDNTDRGCVICLSLGKFLFLILPIFLFFCIGILNAFPLISFGYGFIFHIPDFLVIVIFASAWVYKIPFIIIALIISIALLVTDGFASGFALYSLIICYVSSIPSNCTSMQFTMLVISFFSLLLFALSIVTCVFMIPITRRMLKAVPVKKKRL
jgi:hypothetical protein